MPTLISGVDFRMFITFFFKQVTDKKHFVYCLIEFTYKLMVRFYKLSVFNEKSGKIFFMQFTFMKWNEKTFF